jgi:hypothetical protein
MLLAAHIYRYTINPKLFHEYSTLLLDYVIYPGRVEFFHLELVGFIVLYLLVFTGVFRSLRLFFFPD